MNRKLIAFLTALLMFLSIAQYPVLVIAESMVYHDMGNYRERHNLDGSTTVQIYAEEQSFVSNYMPDENGQDALQEELEPKSEFASVYTPGRRLMSFTIGDMSVSFSPVMIEGPVTIEIPIEPSETPDAQDNSETITTPLPTSEETIIPSPSPSTNPEETEEPKETEEPEGSISSPTPLPEATQEPTPVPTSAPTEAPTPVPTPDTNLRPILHESCGSFSARLCRSPPGVALLRFPSGSLPDEKTSRNLLC